MTLTIQSTAVCWWQALEMEVDTGASLSVISEGTYKNLISENRATPLEKSGIVLRTYTGEEVKPEGVCTVDVDYEGGKYSLPLLVVSGEGPPLLGRNWLEEIKLNWPRIKQLTAHDKRLSEILQKHAQLFGEGLGTLQGTKAKTHVDPTATPIFHKARPVPYALREKIEQDLERLEKAGTIEPVQYSEWATPIVPVMKSDGTVRVWRLQAYLSIRSQNWMATLSLSLMIYTQSWQEVKRLLS